MNLIQFTLLIWGFCFYFGGSVFILFSWISRTSKEVNTTEYEPPQFEYSSWHQTIFKCKCWRKGNIDILICQLFYFQIYRHNKIKYTLRKHVKVENDWPFWSFISVFPIVMFVSFLCYFYFHLFLLIILLLLLFCKKCIISSIFLWSLHIFSLFLTYSWWK